MLVAYHERKSNSKNSQKLIIGTCITWSNFREVIQLNKNQTSSNCSNSSSGNYYSSR